ncbi:Zinc finger BED domain-containing protein RICESLEEPER 2 [Rhynchospora pubera]|uniref:Zinc finger BED domain-containing protein RICESLEEPER 2 n=1 Tax=Rhynchospora pubera TaxID=906938 RepID=A0AAV8GS20_9POAL|nr:Zinc finger BED domain-containing protein RICESLEEPER 2 [Rhynchospora pubera]
MSEQPSEGPHAAGIVGVAVPHNPRARRLRSKVWNDFSKERLPDGSHVAVCHHCHKQLTASSRSGTTHLKNHLAICLSTGTRPARGRRRKLVVRRLLLRQVDQNAGPATADSTPIGYDPNAFDQETSRQDLARMIVRHGYRFSIVDDSGFRTFVTNLQPGFRIPTRESVQSDCMHIHDAARSRLRVALANLPSRVSLSADMWRSAVAGTDYLSLTCHYITDEWKLKKKILNFIQVDSASTSADITSNILEKCQEWGIEKKIASVVLDNCLYSDEVGPELLQLLHNKFDLFHVRSCAHILNLIIQESLELVRDLTDRVRASIRYVKSSQVRFIRFQEAVKQSGLEIDPRPTFLAHDTNSNNVNNNWASLYVMLESVCRYQKAFARLFEWDPEYRAYASADDWPAVSALTECLDVLYHTMEKLPTVENPTANLYFNEICAIHLLLKEWCTNRYTVVATMATQMLEKFEQYWEVNKTVMAFASILDPRYKTKSVEYFFRVVYKDPYESKSRIDGIQASFIRLYNEYAAESAGQSKNEPVFYKGTGRAGTVAGSGLDYSSGAHNKTFSRITLSDAKRGLDQYLEETSSGQTVKSDLDLYLEEAVLRNKEGRVDEASFDVLAWWRAFSAKYPVLSLMARDILGVPVSTVPLDGDARTLNDYLSTMDPVTVEGLICAQDWLRDEDEGPKAEDGTSAASGASDLNGTHGANNVDVPILTN